MDYCQRRFGGWSFLVAFAFVLLLYELGLNVLMKLYCVFFMTVGMKMRQLKIIAFIKYVTACRYGTTPYKQPIFCSQCIEHVQDNV